MFSPEVTSASHVSCDVSDLIRALLSFIEATLPDLPGFDLVQYLPVDVLARDAKQPAERRALNVRNPPLSGSLWV